MLAQNFKSADDLRLSEAQHAALIKTLGLLDRGELRHVDSYEVGVLHSDAEFSGLFSMNVWKGTHPCGTAACIGGTAELVGDTKFVDRALTPSLRELFYPRYGDYDEITPAIAAIGLRNYLTTGRPNWRQARELGGSLNK
jgi:hypothetical protein